MTLQCVDTVMDSARQTDLEWPVAGMEIPLGSYLGPVADIHLLPVHEDFPGTDGSAVKIYSENGRLTSENGDHTWVQSLPAARDLHEQNVVVYRGGGGRVYIRTTRAVAPGATLRGWYEEGLAMELNIPYLTPSHIRGVQDYRCNNCMEVFTFPNLLKLHLMTRCGVNSTRVSPHGVNSTRVSPHGVNAASVSRCHVNLIRTSPGGVCVNSTFHRGDTNSSRRTMVRSSLANRALPLTEWHPNEIPMHDTDYELAIQYQTRTQPSSEQGEHTTILRMFPFPDISQTSANNTKAIDEKESSGQCCVNMNESPNVRPFLLKDTSLHNNSFHRTFPSINCKVSCKFEPYLVKAAVEAVPRIGTIHSQIDETLQERASFQARFGHLGSTTSSRFSESTEGTLDSVHKSFIELTSGKGHMCVYCGKFYSRKYGLKIHLRTHTGYKPLKCKICLRAFGDPSNLNKHVRLHADGNTPYTCPHCGKVLVRRRDLVRHVRSRHSIGITSPETCSVD